MTGSTTQRALSIRGDSIERVYGYYAHRQFVVNRRYQRKLVWGLEEKQAFIESILNGYPVPLILLAETRHAGELKYEIIDGMQRLNAIASFIEGHFSVNGSHFDLNTMAVTKEVLDSGKLAQRRPTLPRAECTALASYQLPLSVYEFSELAEVDEVFRRINSYGRYLSRQDLRQAGATGHFPTLVARLASRIRGDTTAGDRLDLNDMGRISISSRDLPYGIDVDEIFWVQQNILPRDYIRTSRDEELIASILAYVVLDPKPESSSNLLDQLYGTSSGAGAAELSLEVETAVQKHGPEVLERQYLAVHDELRRVLAEAGKPFNRLMFEGAGVRVPRYFEAVFLALWQLVIGRRQQVANLRGLVRALDGIGQKIVNVGGGGGRWGAAERQRNVDAVVGVMAPYMGDSSTDDPALGSWVTLLENLLRQSYTEQNLYDFKQGFHDLRVPFAFNADVVKKCGETLCAMVNKGPGSVGYILVGVTDDQATAQAVEQQYSIRATRFDNFWVIGIGHEADTFHGGQDSYFREIIGKLGALPFPDWVADDVTREARLVRYFDKSVLVLRLGAGSEPAHFGEVFRVRRGSSNDVVTADRLAALFARFGAGGGA